MIPIKAQIAENDTHHKLTENRGLIPALKQFTPHLGGKQQDDQGEQDCRKLYVPGTLPAGGEDFGRSDSEDQKKHQGNRPVTCGSHVLAASCRVSVCR